MRRIRLDLEIEESDFEAIKGMTFDEFAAWAQPMRIVKYACDSNALLAMIEETDPKAFRQFPKDSIAHYATLYMDGALGHCVRDTVRHMQDRLAKREEGRPHPDDPRGLDLLRSQDKRCESE